MILERHSGTILKTKYMMNYVYVYIHTHTTISFSITAYKLSFAFLDVGVYL